MAVPEGAVALDVDWAPPHAQLPGPELLGREVVAVAVMWDPLWVATGRVLQVASCRDFHAAKESSFLSVSIAMFPPILA